MILCKRFCHGCRQRYLLSSGIKWKNARTFHNTGRHYQQSGKEEEKSHWHGVKVPLGMLALAYISYRQYGYIEQREKTKMSNATDLSEVAASSMQVRLYRMLPLKAMSRLWGRLNGVDLPEWLRPPLYKLYIWAFGVNLDEAAVKDLRYYRNLGEFFRRPLARSHRPVDQQHTLTCPSDGKVLHFGRVEAGMVEQVKGLSYSLKHFLGPIPQASVCAATSLASSSSSASSSSASPSSPSPASLGGEGHERMSAQEYEQRTRRHGDRHLYHAVIYLAPGDYHGFHSPTEWTVTHRRHFPGDLLSVNPGIAQWIRGLFNLNERVVYSGTWHYGFFAMVPVGATNVGSVRVYMDKSLLTNQASDEHSVYHDRDFREQASSTGFPEVAGGVPFRRGEPFGEFNLGSTIVLVFEAPQDFQFTVSGGQSVKYGQPLGTVTHAHHGADQGADQGA